MASSDRKASRDLGLFLIRLAVAVVFIFHGAQKLFGWFGGPGLEKTAGFFEQGGSPLPQVSAVLAGAAEFVGGLSMLLGIAMRILILPTIFTMLVAIFHVHWDKGYSLEHGGYEFPLTLALVMLGLVFTGPGHFALYEPSRRRR